jgi:DNA-binding IclR family transcriptional regulator
VAEPGPARTVTAKALDILAAFESTRLPLSLTQISEATGLPLPTAYRLVSELVRWGALTKDSCGRYSIGLRLWEVAQHGGWQFGEAARPYLQDLFSVTAQTAHLAVRQGFEALYVDRVYSSRRVPQASRVGGRLPLHATAVGKVLLAYEQEWIRAAYLARELQACTRHTHVDPVRLGAELAAIREREYATATEEVRQGACSIAVPVLAEAGDAVAAIGLVMPTAHASAMPRYLPVLRSTAQRIQLAMSRHRHPARRVLASQGTR